VRIGDNRLHATDQLPFSEPGLDLVTLRDIRGFLENTPVRTLHDPIPPRQNPEWTQILHALCHPAHTPTLKRQDAEHPLFQPFQELGHHDNRSGDARDRAEDLQSVRGEHHVMLQPPQDVPH
jgi:hypothetical protein